MELKGKYTELELKIFNFLPENGTKMNTIDIMNNIYKKGYAPRNARESALAMTNNLMNKFDENDEPWEIFKSKPRGPQPIYWWREPRKE